MILLLCVFLNYFNTWIIFYIIIYISYILYIIFIFNRAFLVVSFFSQVSGISCSQDWPLDWSPLRSHRGISAFLLLSVTQVKRIFHRVVIFLHLVRRWWCTSAATDPLWFSSAPARAPQTSLNLGQFLYSLSSSLLLLWVILTTLVAELLSLNWAMFCVL